MKKVALATAISTFAATPAFAVSWYYPGSISSGTPTNPLASIIVNSGTVPTTVWYVDPASGTASNKTQPAIQLQNLLSNWTFDFTDLNAVAFTGNIQMGNYKTQTYVEVNANTKIDGRQTYNGVTINMAGVGQYNEATNTFTYNYFNTVVNGGGASTTTDTGAATCANGATSALGKVCTSFATVSKGWEGLALNFVFTEDRLYFIGTLTATDTSGTQLSRNTTTINWYLAPVPPAAWLFGSSLLGLDGLRRRRKA